MFLGTFHNYHLNRARLKNTGLGFNRSTKDYEIVVCYELRNSTVIGMYYSSDDAIWHKFKVLDCLVNPDSISLYNLDHTSPCVTTDYSLYWANWSTMNGKYEIFSDLRIVEFDVEKNKFKPLPVF